MSALQDLLNRYRTAAATPREQGTYFEELTISFLKHEPAYSELYREVVPYAVWADRQGLDRRDVGIDLVAETVRGEVHAVQCKLYASDHRVQKADIDSFFTASGKKPFTHRLIVTTTNHWTEHADEALRDQQTPVTKIDLYALENSVIDWSRFTKPEAPVLRQKKTPRPHQLDALRLVAHGLGEHDRGKLIMACGTGKTFTSLKIAEKLAGSGKRVLFLVPSLALLSQTLTEWTQESETRLHSFAVCSDGDVGKKRSKDSDVVQTFVHELQYPATTDAARLAREVKTRHDGQHMSVVYATYHSIEVIHRAQKEHRLPAFDLIVCDEAHRTTGATFDGLDESPFVRVHDAEYIRGKKRLYMTATPRIYGDKAKASAESDNVTLCSMDDEKLYGPNLYVLTFSEAVKRALLVDYKVVVLSIHESHVNRRIQGLLKDHNNELRVDDASKIIGCWKALSKQGLAEELTGDAHPMKRAVAFCQVIERQKSAKVHKVSSKAIASMFQAVVEAYQESADPNEEVTTRLRCEAAHIDGSMNATEKEEKIAWLKAGGPDDTCRILSNVRCLSEGVDVPALDAVLFLTPRNSQVDVVQSVGRVMRNAPGKTRGYIVLPVVIPVGVEPHEALNDNETYRVVWQVLQALRSHDDKFDAMINKLDLVGADPTKMEIIAVTDRVAKRPQKKNGDAKKQSARKAARGGLAIGAAPKAPPTEEQREFEFDIGELERAIYARIVQKVGNRHHWEDWAKDIAKIARTHIDRITSILEDKTHVREREAFDHFVEELRDDLNDSITREEIIEMLAQHLVTKPVFDALFSGHSFATENPMSRAMQGVLDALQEHRLDKEASTLERFYESVKLRAEGIDSAEGKQKIVVELYDKFFRNAFPKMSERLGIVYTPVELVDFILKSVDHLLRTEFDQTLGSEGVHILDPFTGTGTFITRLIQSGLISKEELPRKYSKEIHANEIVLLAYYIAAVNIEAAYHGSLGGEYKPFEGICLTDTFQLYEKDDIISRVLVDNSARRTRQKKLDIRVIIGNPPYSVGQRDDNDDAANVRYPSLDARLQATYVTRSTGNPRSLYDSYIRAIRWASDRVGASGIIGFVTNAGFVDGKAADGLRKCLAEEFSSLYIFHLRGNQRTAGELSKKEGGKVFGSGSRAPVAISLLVKNPKALRRGIIHFRDVGDYLSREEKLEAVATSGGIAGIAEANGWTLITPDAHGDWIKQRVANFQSHIVLGDKHSGETSLFAGYSNGVKTNRDAWAYGPSKRAVADNMARMIAFYNNAIDGKIAGAVNDNTKIGWSWLLRKRFEKGQRGSFSEAKVIIACYRPFEKLWLYYDGFFNENRYQMTRLFPTGKEDNRVIGVSASESRAGYSVLMTNVVPSLHATDMVGSQYFPLNLYEVSEIECDGKSGNLFKAQGETNGVVRRDGITDVGLAHFLTAYPGEPITKEDLFYYVYGILHSPVYRERYADNLGKELPRIPRVSTAADFWAFSKAGRKLGELHVGYEQASEYPATIEGPKAPTASHYRVERMKFGKGKGKEKDKTVIHYNAFFVVRDIPLAAYGFVVNGKPAIEWLMERQSVTTDKDSGIVRDANAYATETVGDPRYPLSLLLRVITVGLESIKIVGGLPTLEEMPDENRLDSATGVEMAAMTNATPSKLANTPKALAMAKLDPYFDHLPPVSVGLETADTLLVLIRVKATARWTPPAGCEVVSRIGEVYSCRVVLAALQDIVADEKVEAVSSSRPGLPLDCAQSMPYIGVPLAQAAPRNARGGGALVAVIDGGIDVLHECFRDHLGKTRILAVWDQRDPTGPAPVIGGKAAYGTLHTRADIDGYVAAGAVGKRLGRDPEGHGTHVTSIAAGSPIPLVFPGGAAPDAGIVVVVTQINVASGSPNSIGYSSSHVDALAFVDELATSENLPVSVNVSQGMNAGAHDGTSLLEIAFDAFSGGGRKPGRVIVKSAGNERGCAGHAYLQVGGNDAIEWSSKDHTSTDVIEVWFDSRDDLSFVVRPPTGSTSGCVGRASSIYRFTTAHGDTVVAGLTRFHPDNGASQLMVSIQPRTGQTVETGTWSLEITPGTLPAGGHVHAWMERDAFRPIAFKTHVNEDHTLTIPGTARHVISVGAIDIPIPPRLQFGVSAFSCFGPTRDARNQPDLCAPGDKIVAARSGTTSGTLEKSGTSMAAPHVCGAVAVLLGAWVRQNPAPAAVLNLSQVRAGLIASARSPYPGWNRGTGFGRLDLDALLCHFDL